MYLVYLALFAVFVIIEAMTFNLTTIWLAISSLLTSIYAYFYPDNTVIQAFIFIVLSLILIVLTKPLSKKIMPEKSGTNADSLVNETGIVTETINNINSSGQVKVKGQIWSAKSETSALINEGAEVKVKKIEGVKLIVTEL